MVFFHWVLDHNQKKKTFDCLTSNLLKKSIIQNDRLNDLLISRNQNELFIFRLSYLIEA